MTYTREQLIQAMMLYNEDYLISKEDFSEEYSSDEACAAGQVDYLISKIQKEKDEPKCILISTTDPLGFSEMSGMVGEIQKVVKKYGAKYNIQYHFKSALI